MLIKTAILMPEAKEGEVTIVEVETVGFNKTKVDRMMMLPFVSLNLESIQIEKCCSNMHYCSGESSLGGHEGRD